MVELPRAYEHRFHAGNVGDVWKHAALLAWLEAWRADRRAVIETHAGAGRYTLGPTGEWTEGIGQLGAIAVAPPPEMLCLAKYLDVARRAVESHRYPGSPQLIAEALGPHDRLVLHELAPDPAATLAALLVDEPRAELRRADGLAGLPDALRATTGHDTLVFIDPPYADRREWSQVPQAIAQALAVAPETRFLLWYPVKSHARPNAMIGELARVTAGVALELITSPLTFKKNRLNGSGLILVGAPTGLVPTLASLAAALGPHLSAGDGFWQTRGLSWGRGDHAGP